MKNKVILIDDDEIICELGQEMFEMLGVECFVAQTMEETMECIQNHLDEIAFALIDLNLEKVSGVDIFKEILKHDSKFIAIMASGSFIESDAPKYIACGFVDIILKPYSLGTLKGLITKYIK